MQITLRRFLATAVAASGVLASLAAPTCAADFPQKPITIVVPYTPGGSSDSIARLLGKKLSEQFGQPVVVENKPGAGATIGTGYVAKAPADGYTVLLADNAQTTAPALYQNLPYDAVSSFKAIGMVGIAPAMLFAGEQTKLRSIKDMRDDRERSKTGFTIGVGSGSPSHLIAELFQFQSKINLQLIPYKGASQAAADVLGGQVALLFSNPASGAQYIQSGRMNAIGITGTQRLASFPEVATFREQGVTGLEKVSYWFALLAPAGLPSDVSQKWEKALAEALAAPDVARTLTGLGITGLDMTPAQMQSFMTEDRDTWSKVAKDAGVKLQ